MLEWDRQRRWLSTPAERAAAKREAAEGDEVMKEATRSEGVLAESPTVHEQAAVFLSAGDKATTMVPTE